ncbi:hypothetical protein [Lysinibacillus pakistanensis]|uniref:Uncharacterized protein n=1 Tax=Lysinibacillus pakistanensis TaxID=759811 RepID=A0ABX6DDA3_9BACI|nr:hypothetical protein GDS87_11920 [Lysinibacillus pakistanensis]
MVISLHTTESPVSRAERNKINDNWQRIIAGLTKLQTQINILAGGEVDALLERLNKAVEDANIAVQQAIDANNTATQEAIQANNTALQTALQTVSNTLVTLQDAITNANNAATNANAATDSTNKAIQEAQVATQDARNAISSMQNFVNQLGAKSEYNNDVQYFTNNIVTLNGSSFIARQDTKGNPPPTSPTIANDHWQLVASKGDKGERGEKGAKGEDGKDGTGVNIIGELQSEDDLPSVGVPGEAYMIAGNLYVWQENTNTWKNVGPIRGPEGKSAYDLALQNGFEGTMEEWIVSLKGETGPRGPEGPQGPPGQDADLTEITEQLEQMKPKVDNSWQMNKYNATSSINLGDVSHTKAFQFHATNWKSTTNVETLFIVFPTLTVFSGIIKITASSNYNITDAGGGCTVEYNTQFYSGTLHKYSKTITTISPDFAQNYYLNDLTLDNTDKHLLIPIFKAPTANNVMAIEVTLIGNNIPNDIMQKAYITSIDEGSPNALGYPWKPQTPTALMPNTYNATNTITNVGANRATRVFPQVNWKEAGIELWETSFSLPSSVWGILELDIAGYSACSGGAKIVVELGINVTSQSQPSTVFKNVMKVVTSSDGFMENFYVEVEHRPEVRGLYIKVYKRKYNDPITVVTTFTSTVSPMSAFDLLKGFHDGWLFNNIAEVPVVRQKDFDARITENFTSVSNGKAQVASAITGKGVQTASDATFSQMANNINAIPSGKKQTLGTFYMQALSPGQSGSASVNVGFIAQNIMAACGGLIRLGGTNRFYAQSGSYNVSNIVVSGTTITFTITQGSLAGSSNPANYVEFFASE